VDSRKLKRPRHPRRAWILSLATIASLAAVYPAPASNGPPHQPPEVSAVDVYRESVPTSGGPKFLGSGSGRSTPLQPAVALRLRREGGNEARILKQIATSSAFGAPDVRLPATAKPRGPAYVDGWAPHGLWAATQAGLGRARILVLLGLLVGSTLAVLCVRLLSTRPGRVATLRSFKLLPDLVKRR
jgi:hypothetical protein